MQNVTGYGPQRVQDNAPSQTNNTGTPSGASGVKGASGDGITGKTGTENNDSTKLKDKIEELTDVANEVKDVVDEAKDSLEKLGVTFGGGNYLNYTTPNKKVTIGIGKVETDNSNPGGYQPPGLPGGFGINGRIRF